MTEIAECLTIKIVSEEKNVTWSRNHTLQLLEFYQTHKVNVGTLKIRNFKKMWEIISQDFHNIGINMSPSHCENRWRVLERNFKKFIDNANKTGRGRKDFEFAEEMSAILGKKKSIYPPILLDNTTIAHMALEKNVTKMEADYEGSSSSNVTPTRIVEDTNVRSRKHRSFKKKTRMDSLEELKNEKIKYYQEKLKFEKENAGRTQNIEAEKLEQRKRKNDLIEKRNSLIQEQNQLLKDILQTKGSLPLMYKHS